MQKDKLLNKPDGKINRLRILREGAGLSQKELASILKVPPQTVSDWEAYNKNISRLNEFKICEYFSCDSEYLFYRSDERRFPSTNSSFFESLTEEEHRLFQRQISVFMEAIGKRKQ